MPTSSKIVGGLAGILTAAIVCAAAPALVLEGITLWVRMRHPGDPSASDPIGWGLVFFAPVLIPLDLIAGAVAGIIVFRRLTRT